MATANLRFTFGAMLIGCFISVSLSGIGTLQAYYYYRHYRRDPRSMKTLVLVSWLLDVLHSIFVCQGSWHYLVLSWGDLAELDNLTWTVGASIEVTGVITFLVQMFYAHRLWRLSKGKWLVTSVIIVLALVRLGSATATTYEMIRIEHFSTFISEFRWLFTFGLALSAVIDVIITTSICYYLRGSRSGYSSMDDVVHRLLLYTINNGVLTTFASLLAMVFAAAMPHNFIFLSLHFIIAKCYINSLLTTLNSRDVIKRRNESNGMPIQISVDGPESTPRFRRQTGTAMNAMTGGLSSNGIQLSSVNHTATIDSVKVHINVEQTIHDDEGELDADVSPVQSFKTNYYGVMDKKDTLEVVNLA